MSSGLIRFAVAGFLAVAAALASHAGVAQQAPATAPRPAPTAPSPPPAVPPAAQAPAAPSPVPAKPEAPSATNPAPAAPEGANPAGPATSGEASTGEAVDLPARPFAYVEGKADKDEIYSAILSSLSVVKRDMDKANFAPAGRPTRRFRRIRRHRFQISRRISACRGPRRQIEPLRHGQDRTNAERQSDALRASGRVRRH